MRSKFKSIVYGKGTSDLAGSFKPNSTNPVPSGSPVYSSRLGIRGSVLCANPF